MSGIGDYTEALFWRDYYKSLQFPSGFVRKDAIVDVISAGIATELSDVGAPDAIDPLELAESIFDALVQSDAIEARRDSFAGVYHRIIQTELAKYRANYLGSSQIHAVASEIGGSFYPDVFAGFRGLNPHHHIGLSDGILPASDRVVTLKHNQISELEEPIESLIIQLDADNGIPDEPGRKELLIGQIKAGRELLRAGTFKAYLLYATIIRALAELIEKYKDTAIAMVAASLVDLLVKNALGAG